MPRQSWVQTPRAPPSWWRQNAWMLGEVPGCYFMLGNGEGEFHGCSVHNPHYDFNDRLIGLGAECWVRLVEDFLL